MDETAPGLIAPARRSGWRMAAILGLVAFLAGLAVMALVVRQHPGWLGGASPVVTSATLKTAAGQTPVVIVPATGAAAAALPAVDLDALATRETALAARLNDLEMRTAGVSGDAQAASGYATRAEAMLVAFAARRAIERGLGLGYLDEQLRDRFDASEPHAVGVILYAARNPVTLEDLRAGLDAAAPLLVTNGDSGGWLASLRRELTHLVVLHKEGTPSTLPADRLARARRLLDAGQVEAAFAEIGRMPGARQADGWMQAARHYIAARQALDTIESAAIAGPGGAAPAPDGLGPVSAPSGP